MNTARVVLVTGGNRGIGYSIAEEFIAQGYRVAVTARSGSGPQGALSVVADMTNAASLDAAFAEIEEKLGPVEILIANAGITLYFKPAEVIVKPKLPVSSLRLD